MSAHRRNVNALCVPLGVASFRVNRRRSTNERFFASSTKPPADAGETAPPPPGRTVYTTGLPRSATETGVSNLFARYGAVESVHIPHEGGGDGGAGGATPYVVFDSEAAADRVLAEPQEFHGLPLNCQKQAPDVPEQHRPTHAALEERGDTARSQVLLKVPRGLTSEMIQYLKMVRLQTRTEIIMSDIKDRSHTPILLVQGETKRVQEAVTTLEDLIRKRKLERQMKKASLRPGDWLCKCGAYNYRTKQDCYLCNGSQSTVMVAVVDDTNLKMRKPGEEDYEDYE